MYMCMCVKVKSKKLARNESISCVVMYLCYLNHLGGPDRGQGQGQKAAMGTYIDSTFTKIKTYVHKDAIHD